MSVTYQAGFWAHGELTVFGGGAFAKARRAGEAVLARLAGSGVLLRETVVECLGAGACRPQGVDPILARQLTEVVLRVAVADDSREAVERFSRELMPLVTAGPPGTTGYAEGRPRVHPLFRFWPCLVARDRVKPQIAILSVGDDALVNPDETTQAAGVAGENCTIGVPSAELRYSAETEEAGACGVDHRAKGDSPRLGDLAYARSGDKGIHANIGVIARMPDDFPRLCREVTAKRVAAHFGIADEGRVMRYELPNLAALNFVIRGILANPLRVDAQGKALAQVLLEMSLEAP